MIKLLLLCGALAGASVAPQAAVPPSGYAFPDQRGYEVGAATLSPSQQHRSLSAHRAEFETQTKHQFAVVAVKGLGGHSLDDTAAPIFANPWGVGLETALNDKKSDEILNAVTLPIFKVGQMAEGIIAGSEAIIREIPR